MRHLLLRDLVKGLLKISLRDRGEGKGAGDLTLVLREVKTMCWSGGAEVIGGRGGRGTNAGLISMDWY